MLTTYEIRRNYLRTRALRALLTSLVDNGGGIAATAKAARDGLPDIDAGIEALPDLETLLADLENARAHIGYVLGELRERQEELAR